MDKFSVGEIAIVVNTGTGMDGTEVEVIGPLSHHEWYHFETREDRSGLAYECRVPGEIQHWAVRPQYLRKRRPPQDWKALCHLIDTSREVEHV